MASTARLVMPEFIAGVEMIVPPLLCCPSQVPAAATCGSRMPVCTGWLSATAARNACTPATATTAAAATAARTATARRGARQRTSDCRIRPAPSAPSTDSAPPRSRSNRCGKPSAAVRLPAYIRPHQRISVSAARTCPGRRRYLIPAATAARPNRPSQTTEDDSADSRFVTLSTGWLPTAMDTAVEVADVPAPDLPSRYVYAAYATASAPSPASAGLSDPARRRASA